MQVPLLPFRFLLLGSLLLLPSEGLLLLLMDSEQNYVEPKSAAGLSASAKTSSSGAEEETQCQRTENVPYGTAATTSVRVTRTRSDMEEKSELYLNIAPQSQIEDQKPAAPVTDDPRLDDEEPIVKVNQEVFESKETSPTSESGLSIAPSSSSLNPVGVNFILSNTPEQADKEVTDIVPTAETIKDIAPPDESAERAESVPDAKTTDTMSAATTPTDPNATVAGATGNTTEQNIPSFREWAQKALEEEQKKLEEEKRKKEEEKEKKKLLQQQQMQSVKSTESNLTAAEPLQESVKPLKKNFASMDCGAKVIGANPEAQGAGNMILPSRDEYMLNKCTDKAWFVVELCESIKGLKIEIANFELYSSVPHRIRVTMGNAYPSRDKDWALFGEFDAEDDRSVQTFTALDGGVFGRYAKVEILSHYGTEHYCPVSLFRIYGISEIEMIGADDDDDDDINQADGEGGGPADVDQTDQPTQATPGKTSAIVSFIKEKVDQTLQRVVGVFRPKDQNSSVDMVAALNASSLVGNSLKYSVVCPGCGEERQRDVFFLLASNYKLLMQALNNYSLRRSLENGVCQSLGFDFRGDLVCYSSKSREFYETLFGTSGTIALCNAIAVELHALPLALNQTLWAAPAATAATATAATTPADITNSTADKVARPNAAATAEDGTMAQVLPITDAPVAESFPGEAVANGGQATDSHSSPADAKPIISNGDINPIAKGEQARQDANGSKEDNIKLLEGEQDNGSAKSVEDPLSSDSALSSAPAPPTAVPSAKHNNGDGGDESPKRPRDDGMKELPPVVHVTPSSASHISPSSTIDTKTSQSSSAQRESVWQKLSNKIKSLERNVTLSGGYLEELSVRYKKQIEDLQLSVRQVNEALGAASVSREEDRKEIDRLRADIMLVSEGVENMVSKLEAVGIWAIGLHIFFLLVEVIIGFLFLFACCPRARSRHRSSRGLSVHRELQLGQGERGGAANDNTSLTPPSTSATHYVRSPLAVRKNIEELLEIPSPKTVLEKTISLKSVPQKKNGLSNSSNNNLGAASTSLLLSRRQRKRILRKMNKVSSLGRLEDLLCRPSSPHSVYHTFHSGSEGEFRPVVSRRKMSYPLLQTERWGQDSDTGSEGNELLLQRSRFQIQPLHNSIPKLPSNGVMTNGATGQRSNQHRNHNRHQHHLLPVNNKFGLLNSSQHDDDHHNHKTSQFKTGSFAMLNGHHSTAAERYSEEMGGGGSRKGSGSSSSRSKRQKGTTQRQQQQQQQQQHRSKSTSPQRIGETARTRVLFKNFNPDNAEWIRK